MPEQQTHLSDLAETQATDELVTPEDLAARIDMLTADDTVILELFLSEFGNPSRASLSHEQFATILLRTLTSDVQNPREDDYDELYKFRLNAIADRGDLFDDARYNDRMNDPVFARMVKKITETTRSGDFKDYKTERQAANRLIELRAGQPLQRPNEERDAKWNAIFDRLFVL